MWELETGVGFFKFSNCTGTLRGFKENSGVLDLFALFPGSELLLVALARRHRAGSCVWVDEVAILWFCITSLYLLVTKLTWLLTSWPASLLSKSDNKSRMTRASSKKQRKEHKSWHFSFQFAQVNWQKYLNMIITYQEGWDQVGADLALFCSVRYKSGHSRVSHFLLIVNATVFSNLVTRNSFQPINKVITRDCIVWSSRWG